jgi:hypothetical protein
MTYQEPSTHIAYLVAGRDLSMNAAFEHMNIIGISFQSTPNGYKIWPANIGTGELFSRDNAVGE